MCAFAFFILLLLLNSVCTVFIFWQRCNWITTQVLEMFMHGVLVSLQNLIIHSLYQQRAEITVSKFVVKP